MSNKNNDLFTKTLISLKVIVYHKNKVVIIESYLYRWMIQMINFLR